MARSRNIAINVGSLRQSRKELPQPRDAAGWSTHEITAITGHRTLAMVRSADQDAWPDRLGEVVQPGKDRNTRKDAVLN
jgi:hypothetical protein